ncbi:hypothetical protein Bbelb_064410 [Branchiostoma belcheri]|nr:hypothetical protein Bbelb_064410 [Branchiostoma belcheri]
MDAGKTPRSRLLRFCTWSPPTSIIPVATETVAMATYVVITPLKAVASVVLGTLHVVMTTVVCFPWSKRFTGISHPNTTLIPPWDKDYPCPIAALNHTDQHRPAHCSSLGRRQKQKQLGGLPLIIGDGFRSMTRVDRGQGRGRGAATVALAEIPVATTNQSGIASVTAAW